jgi:NOL1/NOP2/fmu family ribosome biogenesis protein
VENPAPGLEHTFRLWPHKLSGEGHFAAVLEKNFCGAGHQSLPCARGDGLRSKPEGLSKSQRSSELTEFVKTNALDLPDGKLLPFGQTLCMVPEEMPELAGLKVLRAGLELGQVLKNRFEPAHAWALWLKHAKNTADFPADGPEIAAYLRGETIPGSQNGWTLITADGLSLGWAKGSGGVLKNHFPKALRHLS